MLDNISKTINLAAQAGDKAYEFDSSVKRSAKDYGAGAAWLSGTVILAGGAWYCFGEARGCFTKRKRKLERVKKKRAQEILQRQKH